MGKIAGFGLLLMAVIAGFTYGYGIATIFIEHNPSLTKTNLITHLLLLKLVILGFLFIFLLDIVVAWSLYYFFNTINRSVSLLAAMMRMGYISFLGMAIYNLVVLNQASQSLEINELFIYQQYQNFMMIWSIGLFIFSIHLLLLGKMCFESDHIPPIIGVLCIVASICYFGTSLASLLYADYVKYKSMLDLYLSLPMALGELGLAFWLILKSKHFTLSTSDPI